jgi:RHS repeat-associated protein
MFSAAGTAGSNSNRYRFTGKELGDETGLYDVSARFLQTSLGRFTTIDPLAEKYPNISPYAYCNGNPVNLVDPDGEVPHAVIFAALGASVAGISAIIQGKSASEVLAATIGGALDGALSSLGVGVMVRVVMGTVGSGAGNLAEQYINIAFGNQDNIDLKEGVKSAGLGAIMTAGGEVAEIGLKKVSKSVIKSDSSRKQLEKDIKSEAKSNGEKIKPKELSRKANQREEEQIEAFDSYIEFYLNMSEQVIGFNNNLYGND